MPTTPLVDPVSGDDLLRAVEQLNPDELRRFVAEVLALRARREAHGLTATEAQLLQRINQGLPDGTRGRFGELIASRDARTLTPDEYAELLRLTDEVEALDAGRMEALATLAQHRGTTLSALMKELGLAAPADG